jgi:hypothetical protein
MASIKTDLSRHCYIGRRLTRIYADLWFFLVNSRPRNVGLLYCFIDYELDTNNCIIADSLVSHKVFGRFDYFPSLVNRSNSRHLI